jgi:hypothetical protein
MDLKETLWIPLRDNPRIYVASVPKYLTVLYRMSQELRSLFQDLIPELIPTQKHYIHMGPVHNGLGVTAF